MDDISKETAEHKLPKLPEPTEATAKRSAKDSVFRDLFRDPKNVFRLFRELHPEVTDVAQEDIELVTLVPILANMIRNDLGFVVRERVKDEQTQEIRFRHRLIILVEAQATWTLNILFRFLLYLAAEYQSYIQKNKLRIHDTALVDLPEPEFYVVYIGESRKVEDVISLRKHVFRNSDANLELRATVIHAPDREKIVGQYVIFCHILDTMFRKYGRTMFALEETIRVCKDENILREYLEQREKEEIFNMMEAMFSEEFRRKADAKALRDAVEEAERRGEARGEKRGEARGEKRGEARGEKRGEARGEKRGEKRGAIRTSVQDWQEFGKSYDETAAMLSSRFQLNADAVKAQMDQFWRIQQ